jgi:hypothetical protein
MDDLTIKRKEKEKQKQKEKMRNTGGQDTNTIVDSQEILESKGWDIELFDFSLDDFTACVDYDNKKAKVNVSSAYYTSNLFLRILQIVSTNGAKPKGSYLYAFKEGENLVYDVDSRPEPDHLGFDFLFLHVEKILPNSGNGAA